MNAFGQLRALVRETRDAGFAEITDDGTASFAFDPETPIHLYADPEAGEAIPFILYAPLLSLAGAGTGTELEFLWRLSERNLVGDLPLGFLLFADREAGIVYLGGQFALDRLDRAAFSGLVGKFATEAKAARVELAGDLREAAGEADSSPIPNYAWSWMTSAGGIPVSWPAASRKGWPGKFSPISAFSGGGTRTETASRRW